MNLKSVVPYEVHTNISSSRNSLLGISRLLSVARTKNEFPPLMRGRPVKRRVNYIEKQTYNHECKLRSSHLQFLPPIGGINQLIISPIILVHALHVCVLTIKIILYFE